MKPSGDGWTRGSVWVMALFRGANPVSSSEDEVNLTVSRIRSS